MALPSDDNQASPPLPIDLPERNRLRSIVSPLYQSERVLDALPGCVVLLTFALVSVSAAIAPRTTIYATGMFALYLALRYLMAGYANLRGLQDIAATEAVDWRAQYDQTAPADALPWAAIKHVVIIPNYNEPETLLTETLTHLAAVDLASEKLIVILAMEAAEPGSQEKGERLQAAFTDCFAGLHVTVHPGRLPGEMRCKSANLAWAGRWLARHLDLKTDHVVVTAMDADTVWHPQYFAALTHAFATDLDRYGRVWQAPIRYHGDIYHIHPTIRPINAFSTAVELAYLRAPWWPSMPISSYSMSLRLLATADYWDTAVIADEWHMLIKAYFAQRGEVRVQPIYLPFTAKATGGATLWQTVKNRYRQSLRHAWGSKELGYAVAQAAGSAQVPLKRRLGLLLSVGHDIVVTGAGWVLVTGGSQLPILFHADLRAEMLNRGLIYPQTLMLEIAGLIMIMLGIAFLNLDVRTRPARAAAPTRRERLQSALGVILLPVFAVVFVTFPILQAQMMLLLGRPLSFNVTAKPVADAGFTQTAKTPGGQD